MIVLNNGKNKKKCAWDGDKWKSDLEEVIINKVHKLCLGVVLLSFLITETKTVCFRLWIPLRWDAILHSGKIPGSRNRRGLVPECLPHALLSHRCTPTPPNGSLLYLCEKYPPLGSYCIQSPETKGDKCWRFACFLFYPFLFSRESQLVGSWSCWAG